MHSEVKKCAEHGDFKGLKYIFVDCLDVDPTFEKYREDYEYCKGIPGFFEYHIELTPLSTEKSEWTIGYWNRLKKDLLKNFSEKRFLHMKDVAKVVHVDKVARLIQERRSEDMAVKREELSQNSIPDIREKQNEKFVIDPEERQRKEIEEYKKKLEDENCKFKEQKRLQDERVKQKRQALANNKSKDKGQFEPKKAMGVVLLIIIVIVIVIMAKVL